MKPCILDRETVLEFFAEHDIKPYRYRQIEQAIFQESIIDFAEMTTLSKHLRTLLDEHFCVLPFGLQTIKEDEETSKFLFESDQGKVFETVMMYHYHTNTATGKGELNRLTLCISSQVGCAVGCVFCVTGKMGLLQNLDWMSILGQVIYANYYIKQKIGQQADGSVLRVRNVVFMGMGEPLMNYPNVKQTCHYLTEQQYFGLSRKRVTVSTSGVYQGLQKFVDDQLPVSLAFSIHAPTQELRAELIPMAKFYKLGRLMELMDEYTNNTGNKVFYEYVMIKDRNDSDQVAHDLGKLLSRRSAHLNLIPYNENPTIDLEESTPEQIRTFQAIVQSHGVTVTVRQNMGRKAKSACGQLGYEKVKEDAKQTS